MTRLKRTTERLFCSIAFLLSCQRQPTPDPSRSPDAGPPVHASVSEAPPELASVSWRAEITWPAPWTFEWIRSECCRSALGWYGPRKQERDASIEFCEKGYAVSPLEILPASPSPYDIQRRVDLGDRAVKARLFLHKDGRIGGDFEVEIPGNSELILGEFRDLSREAANSMITAATRAKLVRSEESGTSRREPSETEAQRSERIRSLLGWKSLPVVQAHRSLWQPPFEPWCYLKFALPAHVPFDVHEENSADCDHYSLQRRGNPLLAFDLRACRMHADTDSSAERDPNSFTERWYREKFTLHWTRHDDRRISARFEPEYRSYMNIYGSTRSPVEGRARDELLAALTSATLTPAPCTEKNRKFCAPCALIEERRARAEADGVLPLLLE